MKWLRRTLWLIILLIVVAAVLPFLIPLSTYIPQIEKEVSGKIHEPVSIRALHVLLLPVPEVKLEGIKIGRTPEGKIETLKIYPDLPSLFADVKIIRSVELESVSVNRELLGRLPLGAEPGGGPQKVMVRKIRLSKVRLDVGKVDLGLLGAEIRFGDDGAWKHARIESEDGKVKIAAKPAKDHYLLDATAKNWQPPAGPPMVFDELNIEAVADADGIKMKNIAGNLYGGSIKGTANLSWSPAWKLNGELQTKGVELHSLVPLFSPSTTVSGKLYADASYAMKGGTAAQLAAAPAVDAKFNVKNGVLYNMDLVQAVKVFTKEGAQGGQTHFDDFSGVMHLANKAFHFSQLKISSGLLSANGNVDISPAKQLAGKVNVQIKGTATLVDMPLTISGTLDNPVLFPSKAAIAGAVAGTAVLGPGVGSALGAKAGGLVEKIFH
jgi:hypothetical protein